MLPPPPSRAADDRPARVVVLIRSNEVYRAAADALVERLHAAGTNCSLLVLPSDQAEARRRTFQSLRQLAPDIIAAGGASMTLAALEAVPRVPVVFFMLPNALDASFLRADSPLRGRVAGVTSDPAPSAQLEWIRQAQPNCKRMAVLCSRHSANTAAALRSAARAYGIHIQPIRAAYDQFPAAIDALNAGKFDGVLMIPDGQVYNSPNVQRLLLWGLRRERGVWGFSDKVVKAGALGGTYSDPVQVGCQAADIVMGILDGQDAAAIGLRYPQTYRRAVNLHTAKIIGLELDREWLAEGVVSFGEQK